VRVEPELTGTGPRPRAAWRTVALPDEHGGWGLTAEPVLLGLLVAASWAGAALAAGAFTAFLVRTPLKLVLVDRRRHRWLPRTRTAAAVAAAELVLLLALGTVAVALAGWTWLVPVGVAAPLVAVELWFDMRSRSRRLVPEVCGAVGVAAVAAAIALADGVDSWLAIGMWVLLAARVIASIPFVRVQIARLRHGSAAVWSSDAAQGAGILVAVAAVVVDGSLVAGALAVLTLACLQLVWVRRPPVPAKVLGLRQLFLGLAVVGVAAAGVLT
jgi:hypothetical protein